MATLVTIDQTDSTNDGAGASTVLEPPQLSNATDDAILIKVTQSLNNSGSVSGITVTTPSGYTLLTDLRDLELRSWVFYKRSTGSESIPNVLSDTSAKWTCATVVVTDVDWDNGGVAQHVQNTATGDTQSQDLTTSSSGNASAIVCFYSLERRACQGFRYPQTRPQTFFAGTVNTGTSEGVDNASAAGYDYIVERSTLWEGPFWEANGGGDSIAINVEVIVNNNVIPLQTSTLIKQAAPSNTLQTNMNWSREILASGKTLDGEVAETWSFTDSDVSTAGNSVTLTAHGMDESMVLYLSDNGNTLPSGLSDDTFYYAFPLDANTISLCSVNEDSDNVSDFYYSGTTQRPVVSLSSTGSGTFTFTEARIVNAGQNALDVFRPDNGNASNPGSAPGSYIGDAGYNQNFVCTSQRFNSVTDLSDEILTFQLQVNSQGRIDRVLLTLIDEDGDWIAWKIYQNGVSARSTGQLDYQFQCGEQSVLDLAYSSHGTFDASRVRYLAVCARGSNASISRFNAVNSARSVVQIGGPFTLINGQESNFSELVTLAESYTDTITKPSDLQVTSTIPIAFGDGSNKISFVDSEKSLAFPPLADGVSTFVNYLGSLGVTVNADANSTVSITNSQIGASVPFTLDVIADPSASVDLGGNGYIFGTADLDDDISYDRQLFVGGEGVTHNGAQIRNSTFIVNSDTQADSGMVELSADFDIQSSAFELQSGTSSAHAIQVSSAGTYALTDLTFTGFGADGSNTAAIYNDSGGLVTINVFQGAAPTVRNSIGSTTVVNELTVLTLTGLQANSEIRVYAAGTTTELAGVENSGTSFTANIGANSVDIVVHALGYIYQRIKGADTSANLTLPVQQQVDRNYKNP